MNTPPSMRWQRMRSPLTALRLRLENPARDDEPRRDEELEGALDELERLGALVDGLLTLARADRAASAPVQLDVAAAIDERVGAWSALAKGQRVQLAARVDGRPHACVTAGRIDQMLDNLPWTRFAIAGRWVTPSVSRLPRHARGTSAGGRRRAQDSGEVSRAPAPEIESDELRPNMRPSRPSLGGPATATPLGDRGRLPSRRGFGSRRRAAPLQRDGRRT